MWHHLFFVKYSRSHCSRWPFLPYYPNIWSWRFAPWWLEEGSFHRQERKTTASGRQETIAFITWQIPSSDHKKGEWARTYTQKKKKPGAHLVIHDTFSQPWGNHFLQRFLFALRLPGQLGRAMTKPCDVILRKDNKINNLKNIYIFVIVLSKLPFTTLKKINKYNFGSLKLGLQFHLHMCDLVLLPVKAFHLILLQFFSGFHVLVVITLHRRYMTTSPYCLVGSETVRHVPRTQIYKKKKKVFLPCSISACAGAGAWCWCTRRWGSLENGRSIPEFV